MQFGKTVFVTVIAALTLGQGAQAGNCMQRPACDSQMVGVGHWVKDESVECRCFQNENNQVVCYTYTQVNRRWVADKQVSPSEVRVNGSTSGHGSNGSSVISEQRIQELRNKYYGEQTRTAGSSTFGGGSSSSSTSGSSTIDILLPGNTVACKVTPIFFGYRFAYLDDRCREYVDTEAMVQNVNGSWTNRALQACQIAGKNSDTARANTCTAIVFDNQVIRQ